MIKENLKIDFDDLLIVPKDQSIIDTRSSINVYDNNMMLPLFTAPMDTVVGYKNAEIFRDNKIYPIIPRTESTLEFTESFLFDNWIALGLNEFEKLINLNFTDTRFILIDVANGNMKKLHDLIVKGKSKFGDKLQLMVGNIANPETYRIVSDFGVDYCRVGVGNGGGCWVEGTKVFTKNGYKNIENITTDDEVLTHTGEWKPVIMTHELNYNEDLIEINGEISTKDHQYYVINKNDSHLITDNNYQKYGYWVNAVDLTDNHLLLKYMIKLKKIKKKIIKNNDDIRVFDITVKDNHSYIVNDVIVHNCLTSKNVGVGYPLASLISECYEISCTLDNPAKIVADGGMKNYSDIIKALALGADRVMVGSIFNRALESAGETFKANVKHVGVETWTEPGEPVDQFSDDVKNAFLNGAKYFKKFRGMSTKSVQKLLGNKVLTTSEGVTRMNQVEYTLEGWTENFTHYLASAMSYSGAKTLDDFIGKADFVKISQNSFNRFNK